MSAPRIIDAIHDPDVEFYYKLLLMKGGAVSFDPVAAAGLVTREVRGGVRDGVATKVAIARRVYSASQSDLWDALTNADRIPRWFLPVSGDLRLGGRYQLEGNAGGAVERCEEPESFAVTWEFGGMLSWLEVTLTPNGDRTVLELAHEAHVDPVSFPASRDGAAFIRAAAAGWAAAATADGDDPAAAQRAAARTVAFYTPPPRAAGAG
jgi:uncharacterized protein YndB with AHSA1/START domain